MTAAGYLAGFATGGVFIYLSLTSFVLLLTPTGSLSSRFRRARGLERLQLRWLAWGAALAAVGLLVALIALIVGGRQRRSPGGCGHLRGPTAAGHRGGDLALSV